MDVIPVIDLRHGQAVAAVRGARTSYAPLASPLALQGSKAGDAEAVARGLCSLFPFSNLYVADLDGIEGRGSNPGLWSRLGAQIPGARVWVDAGLRPDNVRGWDAAGPTPVIGSESLMPGDTAALAALPADDYVLSLDFMGEAFAGPAGLLDAPQVWPRRVIVMTLARVGSGEGPDLERLGTIVQRAGSRKVYAAGGVRNAADIAACREAGAAGVLIATALHAGTITAGDLERIAGR